MSLVQSSIAFYSEMEKELSLGSEGSVLVAYAQLGNIK